MNNNENITRVLNYIDYVCRNDVKHLHNSNIDIFKVFGVQLGKLQIEITSPKSYKFIYTYNNKGVLTELTFIKLIKDE